MKTKSLACKQRIIFVEWKISGTKKFGYCKTIKRAKESIKDYSIQQGISVNGIIEVTRQDGMKETFEQIFFPY